MRVNTIPLPRLALDEVILMPNAFIITWKEQEWPWLNQMRAEAIREPHLYKLIYKNYISWYKSCE